MGELRRWGVFNLVAASGFVVQLAVVALTTRWFGWPGLLATIVATESAVLVNFLGHTRWTWSGYRARSFRAHAWRAGQYQLAKTGSLLAGLGVCAIAMALGAPPELANIVAVIACGGPSYFADRFVFTR